MILIDISILYVIVNYQGFEHSVIWLSRLTFDLDFYLHRNKN